MSQSTFNVPLLAELTDEEREVAMARYQVIVPLLEYPDPSPSKEAWEQAVVQGNYSKKTVRR